MTVEANKFNLPETSFENATLEDIENYYRKALRRGALYFVGFDSSNGLDSQAPAPAADRVSCFVTGDINDQLQTIALRIGGILYQLNDDFYIVRAGSESIMDNYKTSTVFISTLTSEELNKLMMLYKIDGESIGLQTVARGSLLDLVDFQKAFNTLAKNQSIYLIDVAFVDFTIEEKASFQAYLESNTVDLLTVDEFSELFSVYLHCSIDNLRSRNFYSQSLLASDGNTSKFDVGVKHSREQRSISDAGTSTVSGYDSIEDGIQLTFTPQNTIDNKVVCKIVFENSAFSDESYNTKSETSLDVPDVPLVLGKTYYLSSLSNISKSRSLSLFGVDLSGKNRIQTCWARVRRIK